MTADLTASGGYQLAVRRARASRRRRPESDEWPESAPPVALAEGPLGVVQTADRRLERAVAPRTGQHRGKHQAPGWQHELAPDGALTVTTPSDLVALTTPPAYRSAPGR